MMLNSRFELSKIERKNESFSIKLSKIESRKRIFSFHSRKSRVEREFFLSTLENREWKENFLLPLSKIESRKRNGNYQIFEIEREISLSTLDFSLESETLVNACTREMQIGPLAIVTSICLVFALKSSQLTSISVQISF